MLLPTAFSTSSQADMARDPDGRLLFVIAAQGGASLIDSFLPIAASEAKSASAPSYPDEVVVQPPGSNIRTVKNLVGTERFEPFGTHYELSDFLRRHGQDMVVLAHDCTSVNHLVAQHRAVNGAGVNGGRTLMEAVAMTYGHDLSLPNCGLVSGGFVSQGDDPSVPASARAEIVTDPLFFALSMHGSRGVRGAPSRGLIDRARKVRGDLEAASPRAAALQGSGLLERYRARRDGAALSLETADLITRLMLLESDPEHPLATYDLASSPDADLLLQHLPNLGKGDAFQAQTAVAFLLARYGISCALTLGIGELPSFAPSGSVIDTPLAFDFSHTYHLATQQIMWARMMEVVDGLITLLKTQDHLGDPALGKMWDRSLIYIATDFGRTKVRSAADMNFEIGSGHDLNNGSVLISPLLRGNRVFGGVDPGTGHTYGFDRRTGAPARGSVLREEHVYSAICQALGIDFSGRIDMSAMIRAA